MGLDVLANADHPLARPEQKASAIARLALDVDFPIPARAGYEQPKAGAYAGMTGYLKNKGHRGVCNRLLRKVCLSSNGHTRDSQICFDGFQELCGMAASDW